LSAREFSVLKPTPVSTKLYARRHDAATARLAMPDAGAAATDAGTTNGTAATNAAAAIRSTATDAEHAEPIIRDY
jgi:hypothetical protein